MRFFSVGFLVLFAVIGCQPDTPESFVAAGHKALEDGQIEQARTYFAAAAEQGDADGQFWMGHLMLFTSHGQNIVMTKDNAEPIMAPTLDWWQKASAQGHVQASMNLGSQYLIKQDYPQARTYFQRAAEQGEADAFFHLAGVTFLEARPTETDLPAPEVIVQYVTELRRAADAGSKRGAETLATFIANVQTAAAEGNADSQAYLDALEAADLL